MDTLFPLLQRRVRTRAGEPFVTWCGESARVELSAATFANSVAKTAGLLTAELAVQPGDSLRIDLGLHWQFSVWLAAADAVGLDVCVGAEGPQTDFVATADPQDTSAGERILVSVSPFGLPGSAAPAGFIDHAREAPGQPDVYSGPDVGGRLLIEGKWLSGAALRSEALALAASVDLPEHGRLGLSSRAARAPLAAYAVPLLVGGAVVLVADPATADAAEGIDRWYPHGNRD